MKERLVAELDARIARHVNGDSSGVLDGQALALVSELTGLGEPDAGSVVRVAALHLCRYEALPREHGQVDLQVAQALYTKLHTVDPRLVSPEVREFFGLASPLDCGIALLREYERAGRLDHLQRAISLFRQEVLEQRDDRADGLYSLGMALVRRFERTGQQADLNEAIELNRAALAATARHDPRRAGFQSGLADGLLRRFELTGGLSDLDEAIGIRREVVAVTARGPGRAGAVSALAVALSRRFERTGQPPDHDETVHAGRRARDHPR